MTDLDLDSIRRRHDEDHEHDGGCDTLDLLAEVGRLRVAHDAEYMQGHLHYDRAERLEAAVDAVRALVAPQWRSVDHDRNALIDDIRAALDEHLGGER